MTRYMRERGFDDYDELWHWSVEDLDGLLGLDLGLLRRRGRLRPRARVARRCPAPSGSRARASTTPSTCSAARTTTRWRSSHASELREQAEWTWGELRRQTASMAARLRALGVETGDRVAAYMPNIPEAMAAFLATASIGAVWSSCSPDFGARSVIDRFAQIEPKVLLAVDGYRYNGRDFDRRETRRAASPPRPAGRSSRWATSTGPAGPTTPTRRAGRSSALPFDHPLWVLYSSGTTGPAEGDRPGPGRDPARAPQEAPPARRRPGRRPPLLVHHDRLDDVELPRLGPAHRGGDRALRRQPRPARTWTCCGTSPTAPASRRFGTSAAYIARLHEGRGRAGRGPRPVSALRAVGSTGSPLSPEGFRWVYDHVGERHVAVLDQRRHRRVHGVRRRRADRCRSTRASSRRARSGRRVESWDPDGRPLIGEVGELVITEPMPSMPLYFWNDPDGERYRERYFDMYPGVWRHGDWIEITERGTAIISGRSDSTINRGGVRMGTAEIYRAVLALDEVDRRAGGRRPARRRGLDAAVRGAARGRRARRRPRRRASATRVREDCSPRHVPNEVVAVAGGPAHAVGQGARAAGQADPDGHAARRRPRAATRSRTPRRWTSSSAGRDRR